MPVFYRYIARDVVAVFVAACLVLLAIIISFRLANLLNQAATGDLSLHAVWHLLALQMLRFLIVLMPLALVLACAMTLGKLYSDQEIAAAQACGIGEPAIVRALLLVTLPVALFVATMSLWVLPGVYAKQDAVREQAEQEAAMLLFRPNTFRRLDDGTVVFVADAAQQSLTDLFIYREEGRQRSIIRAARGDISSDAAGKVLRLQDGIRVVWDADLSPQGSELTRFAHAALRLPGGRVQPDNRLRNRPTRDLPDNAEGSGELQNRINPALALLLFTGLLPRLTRSKPRSGRYQKLIPVFVLFAVYINGLNLLGSAVEDGRLAPWPGSLWLHVPLLVLLLWLWWPRTLHAGGQ